MMVTTVCQVAPTEFFYYVYSILVSDLARQEDPTKHLSFPIFYLYEFT